MCTFAVLCIRLLRNIPHIQYVYLVGDVNIRIDRVADPSSRQFAEILSAHGLTCHTTTPAHELGGLLDVAAARDDSSAPIVEVVNVGLGDHHLLRWAAPLAKPCLIYSTMTMTVALARCRRLPSHSVSVYTLSN